MAILTVFNSLKRPEYIFRPRQVLTRFRRIGKEVPEKSKVTLPWGATVEVRPRDNVGRDIFFYGIFDRIVPEAIFRLADPGELALEVGANIGQNCSLMAYRVGNRGKVIAFEPHPEIFAELKINASWWCKNDSQSIQFENIALGEAAGEAWLIDGADFHFNRGAASLANGDPNSSGRKHKVTVRRMDEYLTPTTTAGVCKIDVEGHELSVLKGARQTLARRAIRDIIFEDFNSKPSPVTDFLTQHGFTIFKLLSSWLKPRLLKFDHSPSESQPGFSYNYLATLDPQRAQARFAAAGWRCLTCSPHCQ